MPLVLDQPLAVEILELQDFLHVIDGGDPGVLVLVAAESADVVFPVRVDAGLLCDLENLVPVEAGHLVHLPALALIERLIGPAHHRRLA
jgi:hypothetical protein